MSIVGPANIYPSLTTHGIFGGDKRHPRATEFVSKVSMKPKPKFSQSQLEEGRALPRPLRKKYFKALKEQYYATA